MDKHLLIAESIAKLLDNQFEIYGFRFGIDPIIGLIPVAGDIIPVIAGLYMAWIGYKIDLPKSKIYRIIFNTALDTIIGFLPLIGDFGDFAFKSHAMNFEILMSKTKLHEGNIIEGTLV